MNDVSVIFKGLTRKKKFTCPFKLIPSDWDKTQYCVLSHVKIRLKLKIIR